MTFKPLRPTWCEIDLSAVTHNLTHLRQMVGSSVGIFVCVKGDASGCGDVAIARRCEADGVAGLAFGNIDRAIACRDAGVRLPILLYPNCLPEDAAALEHYVLIPTLSTLDDVARWSAEAEAGLKVFLKIDSGGFRAGALPHDAAAVASAIASSGKLHLAGIYGHPMTSYGPVDEDYTNSQIDGFLQALKAIERAGVTVPVRMVASSAIILTRPEADLNAIDPGRLVVGMSFPATLGRQRTWRPALIALKSRLVMVKSLADVEDVAPAPFLPLRPGMRIGLIPYGWSDGYPRKMPSEAVALIRGQYVKLLGPTHSELLRVDLTDLEDAEVGDEVVLLGRSGDKEITLDDLAGQWNMGVPDLFHRIGRSVRRVYLG